MFFIWVSVKRNGQGNCRLLWGSDLELEPPPSFNRYLPIYDKIQKLSRNSFARPKEAETGGTVCQILVF